MRNYFCIAITILCIHFGYNYFFQQFDAIPSIEQTDYYDNGNIKSEYHFIAEKNHWITKHYHRNGDLETIGVVKDGVKFGEWISYDLNGEAHYSYYDNGVRIANDLNVAEILSFKNKTGNLHSK